MDTYLADDLIQNDPEIADRTRARRQALKARKTSRLWILHENSRRVLSEGNFALCMIEGQRGGSHSGL